MNPANKEERSSAEPGEKRARAKENLVQSDTSPTQRGEVRVPRIARCASSSIARESSKVGAVCGSAARTVLCGGRSVMVVPTATTDLVWLMGGSVLVHHAWTGQFPAGDHLRRSCWVPWFSPRVSLMQVEMRCTNCAVICTVSSG